MDDWLIYIVGVFFKIYKLFFVYELIMDMVLKYCKFKVFYGVIKIFC